MQENKHKLERQEAAERERERVREQEREQERERERQRESERSADREKEHEREREREQERQRERVREAERAQEVKREHERELERLREEEREKERIREREKAIAMEQEKQREMERKKAVKIEIILTGVRNHDAITLGNVRCDTVWNQCDTTTRVHWMTDVIGFGKIVELEYYDATHGNRYDGSGINSPTINKEFTKTVCATKFRGAGLHVILQDEDNNDPDLIGEFDCLVSKDTPDWTQEKACSPNNLGFPRVFYKYRTTYVIEDHCSL